MSNDEIYRATQRQLGGAAHQAISAIDAALLDIKGKALGIPVYELFGGAIHPKRGPVPSQGPWDKPDNPL